MFFWHIFNCFYRIETTAPLLFLCESLSCVFGPTIRVRVVICTHIARSVYHRLSSHYNKVPQLRAVDSKISLLQRSPLFGHNTANCSEFWSRFIYLLTIKTTFVSVRKVVLSVERYYNTFTTVLTVQKQEADLNISLTNQTFEQERCFMFEYNSHAHAQV